ncbi:hypothetical protein CLPU_9c01240 [Gottschalkia purinilytica]|uniref:CRISPR associated protein Cas6 C-terminal domain-containing protein n=1 Tax=Gottschalkia purinilytica TaxID=1503 RepID=A0A0L0W9J6_GOTPU|nr:CRISPR-associated endoribonuclease Cas6 [Gottschalkia purinilytica]KNF08228.1 hypothetical protein CLPU_9c01240 [Gottschalkia purinilytica]
MCFYQLTNTIFLKKDVHYIKVGEVIGQSISRLMLEDDYLKKLHKERCYKFCYDIFYPIEKGDKVYKAGKVYIFNIRSFNKEFISKIKTLLRRLDDEYIKVLSIEEKEIKRRHITKIYTRTPVITTVEGKPWIAGEDDLLLLQDRLQKNLEKKYNQIFNEEIKINHSFIQRINILNKKPIASLYKNIKLLGNKLEIYVNEDEDSQKLAHIAAGIGLGEKSSAIGGGFCHIHYLK